MKVKGISRLLSEKIYAYFNDWCPSYQTY
jgi:hypothetical protein